MNFDPWAIVSERRAREASHLSSAAIPLDVLVFLSRSSVWWLQNKFQTRLHRFSPHQSVAGCLTHSKYLLCPWRYVHLLPTFSPFRLAASLSVAPLSRQIISCTHPPPVPVHSYAKPPTEDKAHLCLLTRRNYALYIARGCNTWSGRVKCSFADITLVFHAQSRWWNRKLKSPSL